MILAIGAVAAIGGVAAAALGGITAIGVVAALGVVAAIGVVAAVLTVLAVVASAYYVLQLRAANSAKRRAIFQKLGLSSSTQLRIVGFFHPYCNAGGGGERVLWAAVKAMQETEPNVVNVVYTGDLDASKADIIQKVKTDFDVILDPATLYFIYLQGRRWVEDKTWPQLTLIGQSFGSMYLAWEAMSQLIPDLYIDTMGYAFTFNIVSWVGGIPVGAYVHYPTIRTDMLAGVRSRTVGHTNDVTIARSTILSAGKLVYYRLFMYYYVLSLRRAEFLMVNSNWTKNHVDAILTSQDRILDLVHWLPPWALLKYVLSTSSPSVNESRVVYPPCDTRKLIKFPLKNRERIILSIAQFRPEKDHAGQIYALQELIQSYADMADVKLVLIGGSRNAADAERIGQLRSLSQELGLSNNVEFIVNAPYPNMLDWLSRSSIGLSTMVNEHFGINIVEYMAAGLIPITHASGGPFRDIAVPVAGKPTGYHATNTATYANAFHTVLTLSSTDDAKMRERARAWAVESFSVEGFKQGWEKSGWRKCITW